MVSLEARFSTSTWVYSYRCECSLYDTTNHRGNFPTAMAAKSELNSIMTDESDGRRDVLGRSLSSPGPSHVDRSTGKTAKRTRCTEANLQSVEEAVKYFVVKLTDLQYRRRSRDAIRIFGRPKRRKRRLRTRENLSGSALVG